MNLATATDIVLRHIQGAEPVDQEELGPQAMQGRQIHLPDAANAKPWELALIMRGRHLVLQLPLGISLPKKPKRPQFLRQLLRLNTLFSLPSLRTSRQAGVVVEQSLLAEGIEEDELVQACLAMRHAAEAARARLVRPAT